MKKTLLLSTAMACCLAASAQDNVITVDFESHNYHQTYFADGGDWYTTIMGGDYEFYFDIFGPDGGLESGKTYTLADMNVEYSFGIDYSVYTQVVYASAEYVETVLEDGSKVINATVVSTEGTTYVFAGTWSPADEPDMIQMPEDLATISCTLSCYDLDYGEESFDARLAFDGSDVYLEGCGYVSYFFKTAIKGTVEADGSLVFPMGQCVGFGSTANYFIYGFSWDTFANQDITFVYNEELASYVCTSEIYVSQGMSDQLTSYYEFISDIILTPSEAVAIQQVNTEAQVPVKRFVDGKVQIRANGLNFDAAGMRIK